MFERMKAGWRLAKSVRKSVSGHKGLVTYPLLSGITAIIIFIATFLSLFFTIPLDSGANSSVLLIYIGSFILAYILIGFLATVILLSMMIAYRSILKGDNRGIRESLNKGFTYKKEAIEWAIFYSILVMIMRMIESRFRGFSQIIIGAVGSFIISISTFFAVPAILDYKCGPIEAVKHSVETITRNFGQTFGGIAYIDLYTLAIVLLGFLIFIFGLILGISTLTVVGFAAMLSAGIIIMAIGLILNFTYSNIFKLVIFDYANGKGLPPEFNESDIKIATRQKKSRFGGIMGNSNL
ncbi:DUF6159 family protein [Cuniculiplasma divulgatum]|uniref:Multipass membrane protein n=1 Tax=Cuniculiplasma divulgatum TaxID=1673428 RepID=A0A1N5SEV6_9ARCH|nr:DUF6159 family protein [Cuniculiplasma divulgatum]SIM34544.1 multipass membrane protein [Cuniculiplasma divulgatum]